MRIARGLTSYDGRVIARVNKAGGLYRAGCIDGYEQRRDAVTGMPTGGEILAAPEVR